MIPSYFKTLKAVLQSYIWLIRSGNFVFRSSDTSLVLDCENTYYFAYLPGLLEAFDSGEWYTPFFNWRTVLSLYLKKNSYRGKLAYCLFTSRGSRRMVFTKQHGTPTYPQVGADYFGAIHRVKNGGLAKDEVLLPFVMHDSQYRYASPKPNNPQERDIDVFFSGNSDKASYDQQIFHEAFGILNRHEIGESLKRSRADQLNTLKTGDVNKPIWWIDWRWKPGEVTVDANRIDNDEWNTFLNRASFFLACPGVRMPMCHNLIEAMRCGCIPILQHPLLFHPALEDGVNCLVFNTAESLEAQIDKALEMDSIKRAEMQSAILGYYHEHLHPDAIKSKLLNSQYRRYYFPVNYISTDLWMNNHNGVLEVNNS